MAEEAWTKNGSWATEEPSCSRVVDKRTTPFWSSTMYSSASAVWLTTLSSVRRIPSCACRRTAAFVEGESSRRDSRLSCGSPDDSVPPRSCPTNTTFLRSSSVQLPIAPDFCATAASSRS
jgi:hypothetical protein